MTLTTSFRKQTLLRNIGRLVCWTLRESFTIRWESRAQLLGFERLGLARRSIISTSHKSVRLRSQLQIGM